MTITVLRWLAFIAGIMCGISGVFVAIRTFDEKKGYYWFGLILASSSIAISINSIYAFLA